ncbi:MAG: 16S rRNA (uracil(1498)-N(3))-methyltransferase [Cyanobacteriota bacterium]|jgi:16S rRNA (uracil1498-N3)-methyltransferase
MARERRRLLIPADRLADEVPLSAAEAHYLTRVLRLAPGQGCDVVDGAGRRWSALLVGGDRLQLEQPLAHPLEQQPRRLPSLALAVALPKRDVELIWRMATELGIDHLQPLQAERCVVRNRWPQERWQAILREATEQSERLWLPELALPQTAAAWFSNPCRGLKLLASSRGSDLPHLLERLPSRSSHQADPASRLDQVCLAIGPEGGWSPEEETTALQHGWMPVSAGPTILRTVTAAVTAAAWLAGWRATLSSSSSPAQSP